MSSRCRCSTGRGVAPYEPWFNSVTSLRRTTAAPVSLLARAGSLTSTGHAAAGFAGRRAAAFHPVNTKLESRSASPQSARIESSSIAILQTLLFLVATTKTPFIFGGEFSIDSGDVNVKISRAQLGRTTSQHGWEEKSAPRCQCPPNAINEGWARFDNILSTGDPDRGAIKPKLLQPYRGGRDNKVPLARGQPSLQRQSRPKSCRVFAKASHL